MEFLFKIFANLLNCQRIDIISPELVCLRCDGSVDVWMDYTRAIVPLAVCTKTATFLGLWDQALVYGVNNAGLKCF